MYVIEELFANSNPVIKGYCLTLEDAQEIVKNLTYVMFDDHCMFSGKFVYTKVKEIETTSSEKSTGDLK